MALAHTIIMPPYLSLFLIAQQSKITKNFCLGIFLKIRKTKSRNNATHVVYAALTPLQGGFVGDEVNT